MIETDKQENDLTKNPSPALILAGVRTGGTLLAHALDSHPQMFFVRGEPLHHSNVWAGYLPEIERLTLIFSQTGYLVSGCKLLYAQLYHGGITDFVKGLSPKIIFVHRENMLKQVASYIINKKVREWQLEFRPQHSFEEQPSWGSIAVPPEEFLKAYNLLLGRKKKVEKFLKENGFEVLRISYEQITGDSEIEELPPKQSARLCEFLGVPKRNLLVTLRKINKQEPNELFSNWKEILNAIEGKNGHR